MLKEMIAIASPKSVVYVLGILEMMTARIHDLDCVIRLSLEATNCTYSANTGKRIDCRRITRDLAFRKWLDEMRDYEIRAFTNCRLRPQTAGDLHKPSHSHLFDPDTL